MLALARVTALETAARSWAWATVLLISSSCSGTDGPATPLGNPSAPSGPCNAVTQSFKVPSASHVADCSALPEPIVPPPGGDHYGTWAAFQSYDFPVPYGFLIHAMEHGAVVFYYNCPSGCDAEVAEVEAWLETQPEDPLCTGQGALRRAVLTPDPSLDVRWAVSAWGHTLRASCFDAQAFASFYQAHYGDGPEQLCYAGAAFTEAPCP